VAIAVPIAAGESRRAAVILDISWHHTKCMQYAVSALSAAGVYCLCLNLCMSVCVLRDMNACALQRRTMIDASSCKHNFCPKVTSYNL
jgi:hypothetical protein